MTGFLEIIVLHGVPVHLKKRMAVVSEKQEDNLEIPECLKSGLTVTLDK